MVVRRDDVVAPLRLAAQFERTVAQHLVHVHVDGCARTALNGVNGELIDESARDDLVGRLHEDIADLVREPPRVHVRKCRSLLYLCECDDEVRIKLLSCDVEILDGTHGLYAIVDIIGDFQFTEKIVFDSHSNRSSASSGYQQLYTVYHKSIKKKCFLKIKGALIKRSPSDQRRFCSNKGINRWCVVLCGESRAAFGQKRCAEMARLNVSMLPK